METEKNSVVFDADSQELRITTCYTLEHYLRQHLGMLTYWSAWATYYARDPWILRFKRVRLIRVMGKWMWGLMALYVLAKLLLVARDGLQAFGVLDILVVMLFLLVIFEKRIILWEIRRVAAGGKILHMRGMKATRQLVEECFAAAPVYCQQVVITPNARRVNSLRQGDPPVESLGRRYLKVIHREEEVCLLQLSEKRSRSTVTGAVSLHFAREDYTPVEWDLLLTKLREMKYL